MVKDMGPDGPEERRHWLMPEDVFDAMIEALDEADKGLTAKPKLDRLFERPSPFGDCE